MEKNDKLTSVKIIPETFEKFKIEAVRQKSSFTKLVQRAMYLYLNDDDFKSKINSQTTVQ